MAAGACQRNISQSTINNLPVPARLISGSVGLDEYFTVYERKSLEILAEISQREQALRELKEELSGKVRERIVDVGSGGSEAAA
jgi:hypothetical protein